MTIDEYKAQILVVNEKILLTWFDEVTMLPCVYIDRGALGKRLNEPMDWANTQCTISYEEFLAMKTDIPEGCMSKKQEALLYDLYWRT